MKHKRLKTYLKLGTLLFGIFTIVIACQKDDGQENLENSDELQNVISRKLSFQDIPHLNDVSTTINELSRNLNSNGNGLQRNLDTDSVSIVTDDILYITYSETHTYTFKLLRTNPEYYIENIVLHYNVDTGNYDEYLVQYDISAEEYVDIANGEDLSESANVYISELDSGTVGSILGRSNCTRTCQTYIARCTAGGGHYPGDPECCATRGTCSADQGGYIYQSCSVTCTNEPPDNTIDPGDTTGGGGGGDGNDDVVTNPNTNEPCDLQRGGIGITDNDNGDCSSLVPSAECLKITEVMHNLNVDIQQILQTLAPFANGNFEAAFTVDNTNAIGASEGVQGQSSATIDNNPTNPYTVIAHTHDAYGLTGNGTYSVFSFEDLKILAKTLYNNKIDGTFVAFLITAKGTRYAMTINDTSKFLDLFYMHNNTLPSTADEASKWTISKERMTPLYDNYYDPKNSERKIKETDTDNENVLKHFLKFIDEGDAGLSLFEANENFDSFQPVTLDPMGNVKRNQNPCNTQN